MQEVLTTPFHEIFESKCQFFPNRVAVIFNNEKLTYKELNEKANQLAHHLLEHYQKGAMWR
jgi:non-ribosomal peptide synthetase component F